MIELTKETAKEAGICYLRLNDFDANEVYLIEPYFMNDSRLVRSALAKAEMYANDEDNQDKWENALSRALHNSSFVEDLNKSCIKQLGKSKYYVCDSGIFKIGKKSYTC